MTPAEIIRRIQDEKSEAIKAGLDPASLRGCDFSFIRGLETAIAIIQIAARQEAK
jgi:hypothetical protein